MASIHLTDVTVSAGDPPRDLLSRVSARFEAGTINLILGANGSGKSMILRALLGLQPRREGTITLDGTELRRDFRRLHEVVGVAFQNPDLQIFGETVREDVALAADPAGAPVDDGAVETLLERFGLQECRTAPPWELSGGQKRRLALAGAFAGNPPVLALDEPFLELDYPSILALTTLLQERRDSGACVIVASHETEDLWRIVDQVVVAAAGRIVYAGDREGAREVIGPAVGLRPLRDDPRGAAR